MLGNIIEITENNVIVNLKSNVSNLDNLINNYVVIQDKKQIIGEIISLKGNNLIIELLGEIINNEFSFGITKKPGLNAGVWLLQEDNVPFIISNTEAETKSLFLGYSPIYENVKINIDVNKFFNSHFAILGGTGSGKSWGVASLIQNIFKNQNYVPYNASLFVFDTYGEYQNAFLGIEQQNPHISVKTYTTNLESNDEILKIPPYLLGVDDLAILLNATTPSQLQVLEKALSLVKIFAREEEDILKIKNDIIARAVLDILLSGRPAVQIRDQVFSILSFYKTPQLNLDVILSQPGYDRTLKKCMIIDVDGKLREMELLTDFFTRFLLENKDFDDNVNVMYTLKDLEVAIDFALISEGVLKSEKVYDENNMLKVRIHNLVNGEYSAYFDCKEYLTKENYINKLIDKNNRKAEIINFNINYVDDRFAKTVVKILTKMLFDVLKNLKPRGKMPFHIILEEAHRYVINDNDVNLLGYNIFERISKEGRKYGILLGLITQRPSELSETALSQCNNFLIFKMTHPRDMEYIRRLIPFMTDEISKRLQIIKPGSCYGFGPAFKLPTIINVARPDPTPESNNVDITGTWYVSVEMNVNAIH